MAKGKVLRIRKDVPATWEEALQQFLYWKQAQGRSERTLKDYQNIIGLFYKKHPEAWTGKQKKAVYAFFSEEMKPATYNLRLAYLKQFFAWCVQEGIFPENFLPGTAMAVPGLA